jgi:hypothetical protein
MMQPARLLAPALAALLVAGCGGSEPAARPSKAPSAAAPDAPVRIGEPPDGWCAKWSVTVQSPTGDANVIVSSEPLDPTIDSKDYADAQGELLEDEFPGYDEESFERATAFGMPGYLREFRWTPEDGDPVRQLQSYAADDGTGYVATGTALARDFDDLRDDMVEIMDDARPGSAPRQDCDVG